MKYRNDKVSPWASIAFNWSKGRFWQQWNRHPQAAFQTYYDIKVPVLVLLFVALWFILRGDLFYVLPCVILFLCFSVLLVLRLPRLGKRELILVLFVRLFDLCLFDLSVSSSSWCLGRAAVCDCGTPWTFLLPFLYEKNISDDTQSRSIAFPRHQKKGRWGTNDKTNAIYETTALGIVSRKTIEVLKPVFLARNLTLNSDAAPTYKYIFCPHQGSSTSSVKHHIEIHILKTTVMKQSKEPNGDMKPDTGKSQTGPPWVQWSLIPLENKTCDCGTPWTFLLRFFFVIC